VGFDKHEANNFAVAIAHESGIVVDVWRVQPFGDAPSNPRNYYLVLRDGNDTEITDRQDWKQYKKTHPTCVRRALGATRPATST
jgi:hypothetical protein